MNSKSIPATVQQIKSQKKLFQIQTLKSVPAYLFSENDLADKER